MRVLVTGGRDYRSYPKIMSVLSHLAPAEVIHGDHGCVDMAADVWAGCKRASVYRYPPDWERDGKQAGMVRNQTMFDHGQPDLVVAFPGGAGTADMVRRAQQAGVPVQDERGRDE